jgi:hypothetical protein
MGWGMDYRGPTMAVWVVDSMGMIPGLQLSAHTLTCGQPQA